MENIVKPHILVVDDDTRLRDLLKQFLRDNGFAVTDAINAQDAAAKLDLFVFDLMVLDVMMPGENGVDFAKRIAANAPPILLLTAMSTSDDRIKGLQAGVDDYLVKPFEPQELVLRIQAILRRTQKTLPQKLVVNFGEYSFDIGKSRLQRGDEIIALTGIEQQLLTALASKAPQAVERSELAAILGNLSNERNVDVQITRLRKKLEPDNNKPSYIQTLRGSGYALYID
ncbi:MAG: response regulator [Pseudomonadota bacterium]